MMGFAEQLVSGESNAAPDPVLLAVCRGLLVAVGVGGGGTVPLEALLAGSGPEGSPVREVDVDVLVGVVDARDGEVDGVANALKVFSLMKWPRVAWVGIGLPDFFPRWTSW